MVRARAGWTNREPTGGAESLAKKVARPEKFSIRYLPLDNERLNVLSTVNPAVASRTAGASTVAIGMEP